MKLACASFFLPDLDYAQKLEHALRLGFTGVEVRLEENPDLESQVDDLEAAFEYNTVRPCNVIVRSPAYRAPLDSPEALQAKLASARTAVRIAARLGTTTVVQPEYGPQNPLPAFDRLRQPSAEEQELLYSFLCKTAELAEKEAAVVLLEPINRYESHYYHRLEEAVALCKRVNSPRLRLCADLFHMHMEEQDIAAAFESARDHLHYVQLGDSNRRLPGQGHFDFRAAFTVLSRIGYDGYLSLECQTPEDGDMELLVCTNYLNLCLDFAYKQTPVK